MLLLRDDCSFLSRDGLPDDKDKAPRTTTILDTKIKIDDRQQRDCVWKNSVAQDCKKESFLWSVTTMEAPLF